MLSPIWVSHKFESKTSQCAPFARLFEQAILKEGYIFKGVFLVLCSIFLAVSLLWKPRLFVPTLLLRARAGAADWTLAGKCEYRSYKLKSSLRGSTVNGERCVGQRTL